MSARDQSGISPPRRYFTVAISPFRLLMYVAYCLFLIVIFPYFASRLAHPDYTTALVLAFVLGALVPMCMIFGRRMDFVEPVYWFSAKYYLAFPAAVYFLSTGFAFSEHLLQPGLSRLVVLSEKALLLFVVGYASYLVGYLCFIRNNGPRHIRLPTRYEMAGWVSRLAIASCIAIGLLNFLYLASSYPGGILRFLLDFGQRSNRFDDIAGPVTTFGYQFLYAGVFLWFVILLRDRKLRLSSAESLAFFSVVLMSVLISVSQGRLSQSISYFLILASLGYIFSTNGSQNIRFAAFAGCGLLGAIVLYFFRKVSAGAFGATDAMTIESLAEYASAFMPALGYWLVDKGNVPNLAIVINLLEQDGLAGSHWYGLSFPVALTKLSSLTGDFPNIGQSVSTAWFNEDGGLPPTIIGEMFLNFGIIGVPIGLFLVGVFSAWFYNAVRSSGYFLLYIIYVAILFKFFFLWPKGESSNLVGAFWQFMPTVAVFLVIRAITRVPGIPTAQSGAR